MKWSIKPTRFAVSDESHKVRAQSNTIAFPPQNEFILKPFFFRICNEECRMAPLPQSERGKKVKDKQIFREVDEAESSSRKQLKCSLSTGGIHVKSG